MPCLNSPKRPGKRGLRGAARAVAGLAASHQVAGQRSGLVADLRDGVRVVPVPRRGRAEREKGAAGPAGRVEHRARGVGVDPEPQWIRPGEPATEEILQQRIGRSSYVRTGTGAVDQPAGGELGAGTGTVDADAQACVVPGNRGDM